METQIQKITYLNKEEQITQFFSESDEIFNDRLEVIKKLEKENIAFKDALKLSKIYANCKYKKCKYAPTIYHSIKRFL
jgi:cell shape-determining protein MreC